MDIPVPSQCKTIAVSGGFDPIHVGHIRMIQEAARHGGVIIIANSDTWLMRKKGYVFMPYEERQEVLYGIKGVIDVVMADDADDTVCKTLEKLNPDIFANGGDRKEGTVPEYEVCKQLGIKMLFGIGGNDKSQSSSWLVDKIRSIK